jgi:hypothetical protein
VCCWHQVGAPATELAMNLLFGEVPPYIVLLPTLRHGGLQHLPFSKKSAPERALHHTMPTTALTRLSSTVSVHVSM